MALCPGCAHPMEQCSCGKLAREDSIGIRINLTNLFRKWRTKKDGNDSGKACEHLGADRKDC